MADVTGPISTLPSDLRPRRDFEEGLSGRVYEVCSACVKRENERLAEELDYYDDFIEDDCWNCGGDGYVSSCFEEFACVDPDSGCDECTRTCDVCKGKGALR